MLKPEKVTPPSNHNVGASKPVPAKTGTTMKIFNTVTGKNQTLDTYTVLCSIVQSELNSGHIEAIKAQAVASYTKYLNDKLHGAVLRVRILDQSRVNSVVKQAVKAVEGQAMYYNGNLLRLCIVHQQVDILRVVAMFTLKTYHI